jgi:hypothetical protein
MLRAFGFRLVLRLLRLVAGGRRHQKMDAADNRVVRLLRCLTGANFIRYGTAAEKNPVRDLLHAGSLKHHVHAAEMKPGARAAHTARFDLAQIGKLQNAVAAAFLAGKPDKAAAAAA